MGLEQALADVSIAVHDWRPMLARVRDLIAEMKANPPPLPQAEQTEAVEFMDWLVAENFTFLGIREYRVAGKNREPVLVPDSGLGVLRRADAHELRARAGHEVITAALHAFYAEPTALLITKASLRSRVHRRVFMDMVSVKRFDADGNVSGEFRIVGLFTSTAYTRSTRSIPYLRRKVDALLEARALQPVGAFRQGAGQRARDLSARRPVPHRRRSAVRIRDADPGSGRAPARARAGAARPFRPLHVGAGLSAARAFLERCGGGGRRASVPAATRAMSAGSACSSRKDR